MADNDNTDDVKHVTDNKRMGKKQNQNQLKYWTIGNKIFGSSRGQFFKKQKQIQICKICKFNEKKHHPYYLYIKYIIVMIDF